MSIDLSRPLVAAMGQHDPLDGLITCLEIREQTAGLPERSTPALDAQIIELDEMCRGAKWTTFDPLGLGGLLADAWRLVRQTRVNMAVPQPGLLQNMLDAAVVGLSIYTRDNHLLLPAAERLAFRELGLSIGLQAIARISSFVAWHPEIFSSEPRLVLLLDALKQYLPLREQIEQFWLEPENREVPSWRDHGDINMVMLATSLAPEGYLDL